MIACITTCRRPELFARTIKSFAENAKDLSQIGVVKIFDDGSDEDHVNAMLTALKDSWSDSYRYVHCNRSNFRSHQRNVELERQYIVGTGSAYWLHLEDDFEIIRAGCPILAALDVLLNEPRCCQCCLGRPDTYEEAIRRDPGFPLMTPTGTRYGLMPEHPNPENWVGFTLNPSIMRVQAFREVGEFREGQMEHNYGVRLAEKGWRTAHLTPHWLRHIGDGQSAYDLTGAKR
jgi:hypothetical protein